MQTNGAIIYMAILAFEQRQSKAATFPSIRQQNRFHNADNPYLLQPFGVGFFWRGHMNAGGVNWHELMPNDIFFQIKMHFWVCSAESDSPILAAVTCKCVRSPDATQNDYYQRLFDPWRVETRLHYLEVICLSSIKIQCEQFFTILIMASQAMPKHKKSLSP